MECDRVEQVLTESIVTIQLDKLIVVVTTSTKCERNLGLQSEIGR